MVFSDKKKLYVCRILYNLPMLYFKQQYFGGKYYILYNYIYHPKMLNNRFMKKNKIYFVVP